MMIITARICEWRNGVQRSICAAKNPNRACRRWVILDRANRSWLPFDVGFDLKAT